MFQSIYKAFHRMSFYAVARGRNVGIYKTWPDCETQVKGFAGAIFKKFKTNDEATKFIAEKQSTTSFSTLARATATSNGHNTASKRPLSGNGNASGGTSKKAKIDQESTENFTSNIKEMKQYADHHFLEDTDGYVHVYTDGSCENNGKPNAVAGYGVYFCEGHKLNTSAPVIGPATNNRGEIQAATKAISLAASVGISKLCINADSKFVIQAVTEWISNWKKRNWRLVSGKPVKNETDFKQLDHVITSNPQMTIIWKHVPAHVGIHGNERADELAKHGATMYRRKD